MGFPEAPPNPSPHLYPQSLQLKLYQAFIFSIPILFSIILLLLFYLFYLKRRASLASSPHRPSLPTSLNHALFPSSSDMVLKGNLKDNLPIILFDEDLTLRDSMCSVCLGEFVIKEEVHQIPPCKHVFHVDCIRYWLHSNPTCPLCRCFIVTTTTTSTKHSHSQLPVEPNLVRQDNHNLNHIVSDPEDQQEQQQLVIMANNLREEVH